MHAVIGGKTEAFTELLAAYANIEAIDNVRRLALDTGGVFRSWGASGLVMYGLPCGCMQMNNSGAYHGSR
jgi:hypothetical protein